MPVTYDPIATTNITSNIQFIEFTSIPQTFTDLIIILTARADSSQYNVRLRVGNNSFDTASNYSYTYITGNGTTAASARSSNQISAFLDYNAFAAADNQHNGIYHFMNYSNTTTNKTILSRSNRAASGTDATVVLWRSTSAINQIQLALGAVASGNFASGSVATLYGIKAA